MRVDENAIGRGKPRKKQRPQVLSVLNVPTQTKNSEPSSDLDPSLSQSILIRPQIGVFSHRFLEVLAQHSVLLDREPLVL